MRRQSITYKPGLFDECKSEDNYDRWNFPYLVESLGFKMDCYESFREYAKDNNLHVEPGAYNREARRLVLYVLEHADRQIVGNYLFSAWRDYTHWKTPSDEDRVTDFLRRIIAILESKY